MAMFQTWSPLGLAGALEFAARACASAARTLKMAARACPPVLPGRSKWLPGLALVPSEHSQWLFGFATVPPERSNAAWACLHAKALESAWTCPGATTAREIFVRSFSLVPLKIVVEAPFWMLVAMQLCCSARTENEIKITT